MASTRRRVADDRDARPWELLDAQEMHGGPFAAAELRDRGIFATRQLAKRQLTWLRSMPERHVIACDRPDMLGRLIETVDQTLAARPTPFIPTENR